MTTAKPSKIVWLEDQKRFFTDIARSLSEIGYCVTFAESMEEFKALLENSTTISHLSILEQGTFNG